LIFHKESFPYLLVWDLSYATYWRSKFRDVLFRARIILDQHSPDEFRVIGPLQNFTPFYIIFHIKEGDKMYKPEAERIKIW
jgi:putative endopeptidase